jgi:predicted glycoside hydrolase/deacetylase ChbG (UPF0249 family)
MQRQEAALAVVVTADDFGIGVKTSEGIIQAHRNGPVTATSLMTITEDHVARSVPLLADAPELDVGLHLVLTHCGHRPLAAKKSSGLVGRDGFFHSNGRLWMKSFSDGLNKAAVVEEISAQAEMFRRLLGRAPSYVDCHHHAHELPTIREAIVEVISSGLLPAITRTTIEPPGVWRNVRGVRMKRMAAGMIGRRAAELFAAHHICSNDYFLGMISAADQRKEFPWDDFLRSLPKHGIVEWVVHPGYADETLQGRDDYVAQREKELRSLTSAAGQNEWKGIKPFLTRKSRLFEDGKDLKN